MYGKKLVKRLGSVLIAAVIVASAFAVLPQNDTVKAGTVNGTSIVLTEIMYNPTTGNEWIELYNMGDQEVNVTGWTVKDDDGNTFATLDGTIGPYEYMVVNGSGAVLNNDGDTILVYDTAALEVINVTYSDEAAANHSLELNEADEWVEGPDGGTPSMPNDAMVPPVTTYDIAEEEMPWGWYVTNVTVTLTATDDTGVMDTKYRIDGGAWNTYTDPFVISEPGKHLVEFYSKDVWGAEEAMKNFTVAIANTSSGLSVTPTSADWNDTVTIEVTGGVGNVALYAPREDTPRKGPQTGGYIRWSSVLLDVSGKWWVVDEVDADTTNAAAIDVSPLSLDVNATPDEVDYVKFGQPGTYVNIDGTVMLNGAAATQATVKLTYPDGSFTTTTPGTDGSFHFLDVNIGEKGAGEYNISAYIGDETYPNAFGYDVMVVNVVEPNITLLNNNAVGGFDIGYISFEITYPEDAAQLLPGNDYNISIYKDGELYAWVNTTGEDNQAKVMFTVDGKVLNLTSTMWEAGDYTMKVKVDVTGDGNWEYVGETDYTVQAAPEVNTKLLSSSEINVLDPDNNSQVIQIQIFGGNMTTYGNKSNLNIGDNMENVTERIKVEGDVLYTPPKEAYEYWKDGIWNITVFPADGNGKIYVNVTWPDKEAVAGETITVNKGGIVTATPATIIVDTPTDITVNVTDNYGNIIANAQVTLYYEDATTMYALDGQVTNGSITGDGSAGKGQGGVYNFHISSDYAARNIIVVAVFQTPGGETFYGYAKIRSQPAHDLNVAFSPANIMAGEKTTCTVNITRGNESYADNFEFYVLNATELQKLHDGDLDVDTLTPIHTGDKANDTFDIVETEPGTYYIYVTTQDRKHDNMNSEPSFEVSKVEVTVTPSLLVKGVDTNMTLTFTVTWNGEDVNGTLYINGIKEVASYETYVENESIEVEIVNGTGSIENVTAIATGTVTFKFMSETEGSVAVDADGSLEITTPEIEIIEPAEKVAFLAEENLITIQVKHPLTGEGVAGLDVEIITPTRADPVPVGKTDENGKLIFGIVPLQTGTIKVLVGGEEAGEITIWVGLKIVMSSEIEKDNEVTILITTKGGKPVEGATVKVDGVTIGTTNANGEIKYKPTDEGTITVTAQKDGYYSATKTVEVKKGAESPGFGFIGIAIAIALVALIARRRK